MRTKNDNVSKMMTQKKLQKNARKFLRKDKTATSPRSTKSSPRGPHGYWAPAVTRIKRSECLAKSRPVTLNRMDLYFK